VLKSRRTVPEPFYLDQYFKREVLVFESGDESLPTAVIFRDSTSDFTHQLIAQHFRRSVFIWHEGGVLDEVIEREQPDFVLHIMAERFVSAYGSKFADFSKIVAPPGASGTN